MKSEWKLFGVVTVFCVVVAPLYAWWTWANGDRVEWVGTVALILTALLTLMCGGFFWVISRRIDLRPEDRADGEIDDAVGDIGFFSPGSYWPFGVALSALGAALGLVFMQIWLIAASAVAIILAVSGLLFEYYTGSRRSAEH